MFHAHAVCFEMAAYQNRFSLFRSFFERQINDVRIYAQTGFRKIGTGSYYGDEQVLEGLEIVRNDTSLCTGELEAPKRLENRADRIQCFLEM